MTPEEQAIVDFVRADHTWVGGEIVRLRDALIASEQPPAPVFPDPPTDRVAYQGRIGYIRHDNGASNNTDMWRRLRVTYTPFDEPAPEVIERWGVIYDNGSGDFNPYYNEEDARLIVKGNKAWQLVRITATVIDNE